MADSEEGEGVAKVGWFEQGSRSRYFFAIAAVCGSILVGSNVIASSTDESLNREGTEVQKSFKDPLEDIMEDGEAARGYAADALQKVEEIMAALAELGIELPQQASEEDRSEPGN